MFLRLDKIISDSGVAARRETGALIRRGCVTVDGKIAVSGAEKYDPETVSIMVKGTPLEYKKFRYIMLNKPAGYISATEDKKEKTVIELLGSEYSKFRLFPVGRLDKDAEGLLLLTNDGNFAHSITSPSKDIYKRYFVEIDSNVGAREVAAFARGLTLGDGTLCRPALLEPAGEHAAYITLAEGKYHQVKRMTAAVGKQVLYLKRIAIGGIVLDEDLSLGGYRELSEKEMTGIFLRSNKIVKKITESNELAIEY